MKYKVQAIVMPKYEAWEISIYDADKPYPKMFGWFDANKLPYSVVQSDMTRHLLPVARRLLCEEIQRGAKLLAAKMNREEKRRAAKVIVS